MRSEFLTHVIGFEMHKVIFKTLKAHDCHSKLNILNAFSLLAGIALTPPLKMAGPTVMVMMQRGMIATQTHHVQV